MRERGNGSKQSISCLDKALSVAEAWHTVFSLTDTSQHYACTTHAHKNIHTQAGGEKAFQVKVHFACTYVLCCCDCVVVMVCVCVSENRVTASPPQRQKPQKENALSPLPVPLTVTQVKPALAVYLNGSTCVIRHGFVTLLLTRVEHWSDIAQL